MTTKNWILAAIAISMLACTEKKPADETTGELMEETPVAETASPISITCWVYDNDEDLIGMTLTMTGNQVSGKLAYTVYDRDRNSGSISGEMRGDTIIADYEYVAGGKRRVQEVVFLFRDNAFVEGLGPTVERDGKIVFRNRSELKFVQDRPMRSVPCHK